MISVSRVALLSSSSNVLDVVRMESENHNEYHYMLKGGLDIHGAFWLI
jgi:hypothetical protein